MSELLNIEHLSVSFAAEEGKMEAVRDVSFSLKSGEVLAIVGESGCGISGEENAETAGKHVFYGISGSDECTGSDGPYRQADR